MTADPSVDVQRFAPLMTTQRQSDYTSNFLETWQDNEFWEEVAVSEPVHVPGVFEVREEDVLAYNRALGETDPLFIDPDHARRHAPDGTVVVHPIFATAVIFWFAQPGTQGSWIRTPGARNPFQRMVFHERMRVGDRLRVVQDNSDRWWRRGQAYITTHGLVEDGARTPKFEFWGTLILPPDRAAVRTFAEA